MAAYLCDIDRQAEAADGFCGLPQIPLKDQNSTIFTGSGDSLAAAMLAEAFSDYRVRALDPQVIGRNPGIAEGRSLYVVSVSGRTSANIRLSSEMDVTAITAVPESDMARKARRIIPLSFPNSDTLTAGSISFLNSALVCLSLVHPVHLQNTRHILECARQESANSPLGGNTYFVGNQYTFPIAMYAAAKMYEILGYPAHYARTEQFAHMELFSAGPGDAVFFFDDTDAIRRMARSLGKNGIRCMIVAPHLDNSICDIMYYVFYAQTLPLQNARGRINVHFMEDRAILNISDDAIY